MCEDRGHFWLSLVAMHRVGFVMLETPDRLASSLCLAHPRELSSQNLSLSLGDWRSVQPTHSHSAATYGAQSFPPKSSASGMEALLLVPNLS